MQRFRIQHLTEYSFPTQVTLNQHRLLLRPREGPDVRIEASALKISPAYSIKWQRDVFDNSLAMVDFLARSDRLTIASEVIIQHYKQAPYDFLVEEYAVNYPFAYALGEQADLAAFQQPVFINDQGAVDQWLQQLDLRGMQTFGLLVKVNQAISRQFRYQVREEAGVQTPAQTLIKRSGSCRDYATLFVEACRCLGLAGRFVSGYVHTPATEAGNATTHAWAEVYLPGAGWMGFDSTAGELTGDRHIAVAVARNPEAVPPVSGSFTAPGLATPAMLVNVQVKLLI